MAKKGNTKTKAVITDDMPVTELIENIANDAISDEVKELTKAVEAALPENELLNIAENTNTEELLPKLNEKMAELDNLQAEIEKTIVETTKKYSNSQLTYMWNGMNLFE